MPKDKSDIPDPWRAYMGADDSMAHALYRNHMDEVPINRDTGERVFPRPDHSMREAIFNPRGQKS